MRFFSGGEALEKLEQNTKSENSESLFSRDCLSLTIVQTHHGLERKDRLFELQDVNKRKVNWRHKDCIMSDIEDAMLWRGGFKGQSEYMMTGSYESSRT